MFEHLRKVTDGDELDGLFDLLIHLVQIGLVGFRDEHGGNTLAEGCHALFFQAADGQNIAVQGDFARHGKVVADWNLGQRRNQRGGQGDTGGGAILGYSAFGGMDMDIGVLELIRRNVVGFGMYAGIGQCQVSALFHYITQAAGDLHLAGSVGDDGNFDGKHLSAHTGPGQAVGNANSIGAGNKGRLNLFGTEHCFDHGRGNIDLIFLPCGDPLSALAQHGGDGALQCTHAGFAGVEVDDGVQRLIVDLEGRRFLAVLLELLREQVFFRDVEFLLAGVA